jgi:hypothetical protein
MIRLYDGTKGAPLREVLDARGAFDLYTALRIASRVGEALEAPLECDEQVAVVHRVAFVYSRYPPVSVRKPGQCAGLLPHRGHEFRVTREFVP